MNQQYFFTTLISLFHSVEEHLHNHNLELALSVVLSILACDRNNYYARAIEHRIKRVLDFQRQPSDISYSKEYSIAIVIASLENVCQMAVRFLTNISTGALS